MGQTAGFAAGSLFPDRLLVRLRDSWWVYVSFNRKTDLKVELFEQFRRDFQKYINAGSVFGVAVLWRFFSASA